MWIAGQRTLNQFDKFKAEIFSKKKDEFKQKQKQIKTQSKLSQSHVPTNHPFLRRITIFTILTTGLYFANQQFKIVSQISTYVDTLHLNPISTATYGALYNDVTRRISTNPQHHTLSQTKNNRFANTYFISELQLYLKKIEQTNVPRIVSEQKNSSVSFGPFKFGCRHQKMLVTQQGNVQRQSYKTKIKIGSLNIIGQKVTETLQRQTTKELFHKYKENNVEESCKTINVINKIFLDSEKYSSIFNQCVQKSSSIYERIQENVARYQKKQEKRNKTSSFFITFS